MKIVLQFCAIFVIFLYVACGQAIASPLTVHTQEGKIVFDVEIARTPQEQEHGLMQRSSMPQNAGMVFPLNPPQPVSMWMKDTLIPLDMLFIGPDKKIINIAHNAKPQDETIIPSGGPVAAVVELNGGTAKRLHLRVGDEVSYE